MIKWPVKKTLNLAAVQIKANYTISPSRRQNIHYQFGGNWFAAGGFPILPGVPKQRTNGGYVFGGSPFSGIDNYSLLDNGIIYRVVMALKNKNVGPADRLF